MREKATKEWVLAVVQMVQIAQFICDKGRNDVTQCKLPLYKYWHCVYRLQGVNTASRATGLYWTFLDTKKLIFYIGQCMGAEKPTFPASKYLSPQSEISTMRPISLGCICCQLFYSEPLCKTRCFHLMQLVTNLM